MAKKRAALSPENVRRALGTDILDRILEAEGLAEVPVIEASIDRIDPNPFQTRREFDEEGMNELAKSMQAHGFYGNLVARQVGDRYQIAYGERRLRAAQRARLTQLLLAVRDLTDEQMMELSVTENVLRKDLNPIEEAEAYQHLVDLGRSLREISERVGKSPGHISMLLTLLKQEDVTEAVRQKKIGIREAHEIAKVGDETMRRELVNRTVRGELDREAVKQAVNIVQEQAAALPPPAPSNLAKDSSVKSEVGAQEIVAQPVSEAEIEGDKVITPLDMPPHIPDIYDPMPNLRAALTRLEKIRPDRFANIMARTRNDVRALLDEIISRGQYFLEQLGDDPEC
ncbi:MAG: hypothetical protein BroJett011_42190 [Chloroflexota bacterium]|nr:MAG: hypothetical protein BroJett011_42190 [Chloroflexota bacterium]